MMPPVTVADSLSTQKPDREKLGLEHTREFVGRIFGSELHPLRVLSLANGVAWVLHAAVLSIHAVGQAYANLAKITAKSGVKQVDRMLGNDGLPLDTVLARWVRFVVGDDASILIALDWTESASTRSSAISSM